MHLSIFYCTKKSVLGISDNTSKYNRAMTFTRLSIKERHTKLSEAFSRLEAVRKQHEWPTSLSTWIWDDWDVPSCPSLEEENHGHSEKPFTWKPQ